MTATDQITPARADNSASGALQVYSALPRDHVFFLSDGTSVRLNGRPLSALVDGSGAPQASGRYGVTALDPGLWERIRAEHADSVLLGPHSNLIFVEPNRDRGDARAREQEDVRTGFEPVSPKAAKTRPARGDGGPRNRG
ncbi:hypothetical protein IHV25_07490 [Phaeovibrio sulfidiphilus]|uniref:Uncharacterized protein n=1 Tax=Phaeovibrio sulfidiphilus TaxID=1220600 RepID=A0A8J7CE29_9PROT|nr:hypothetical protein [Phaeovibrio sulfidiphilus]MBE1237489.1 hypothetical protein [Phaeovibrio sulfidiphilus]